VLVDGWALKIKIKQRKKNQSKASPPLGLHGFFLKLLFVWCVIIIIVFQGLFGWATPSLVFWSLLPNQKAD
jgi:hypothetical protein